MKQTRARYISIVLPFLILKASDLFVPSQNSFLTHQNIQTPHSFIPFILNALFLYFLLQPTSLLVITPILLLILLYLPIIRQILKEKPLNSDYLI
ncbi:ABC transporter permease, partial [Bacillus thuringiensis]|uniref:ABC transporter permease n=1 Tax=Bacillus thuringiensis TaxID=1428 RepID=UPI0021B5585F